MGTCTGRTAGRGTSTDGIRVGSGVPGDVLIRTLHGRFGSASPGSAHFRAVYSSGDGPVKVFRPVDGATVEGQSPPDPGAKISTRVTVPGADFEYTRVVKTDENGPFSVTVPYPGYYEVAGNGAMVSVSDVENGEPVRLDR